MSLDTLFKQKKQDATNAANAANADDDGEFRSRAEENLADDLDAPKPSKTPRLNKRSANTRRRNEDEVQLPEKKRARRRLIGAVALVLAAVIGLPMVFESEPKSTAPNISIEIPSKDANGPVQIKEVARAPQLPANVASQVTAQSIDKTEEIIAPPPANSTATSAATSAASSAATSTPTAASKPEVKVLPDATVAKLDTAKAESAKKPEVKLETKHDIKPETKSETKADNKVEAKPENKLDSKAQAKNENKPEAKKDNKDEAARALALLEGRSEAGTKESKDAKASEKTVAKTAGSFSVQVAAMSSQAKIKELQAKLKAADIQTYTQKITTDNGEVIRVRVGPFANKAEAEKMQKKLVKLGMNGSLIPH